MRHGAEADLKEFGKDVEEAGDLREEIKRHNEKLLLLYQRLNTILRDSSTKKT